MIRKINYAAINPNRTKELEYIDKQLEKAGYGYIPRLAILGNVHQESSGNPLAISNNGAWHGIIQWNKDRYRLQNKNPQDELQRQTALLLKELEKTGWSGATWRDQLQYAQSFKDSTDLKQAVDIFTRRFVRPGNIESEINKRYEHAQRGWTEETPKLDLEIVKKELPNNLIQARRNMNNKIINSSEAKSNIRPRINNRPNWIPTSTVPTEQEIRNLVYNAFKYQKGGIVYTGFDQESLDFRDFDTRNSKFPVEPVVIYKPNITNPTPVTVEQPYTPAPLVPKGIVEYKSKDTDIGNMKELVELMKDEGISFRITSGSRPGALTSKGLPSHHSTGNALDITPIQGQTWDDLINQMKKSKKFIAYMKEHRLGILDERSPEMQARTGATGAHFHIGPDLQAISNFNLMFG